MEHGFIKVAAMSPDLRVSDCDYNAQKIIEAIGFANKHEVKLLCFPKLCVTGATCEDLFFQSSLQDGALTAVLKIAEVSADLQMVVIIGAPIILNNKLYDCEIVVYNGSVIAVVPTIGSSRQFSVPKDEDSLIMIDNRTVPFSTKLSFRATACKDFSFGFDEASNIILCPFAEFETVSAENDRRLKAQYLSHALCCGYIMSGAAAGESSTNGVFSGHQIIAENGEILSESLPFGKMMTISEIDVKKIAALRLKSPALPDDKLGCYNILELDIRISRTALTRYIPANPFVPQNADELQKRCRRALEIQTSALKKRVDHINAKGLVIGISGGLDSCLALLVCCGAMDPEKITAITMPCFGTGDRTKNNACRLCELLGVKCLEIPIFEAVRQHFSDIGHDIENTDAVYENGQARERTQILMDYANEIGGIAVGTGDLSELALGWATYNGDHMSMYGVNAGIPKTFIQQIVRYISETSDNKELCEVLISIVDTPISPELLPKSGTGMAQKTEDFVGPYELHDFYLYYVVRYGFSPKKILHMAEYAFKDRFCHDELLKWLRIFYQRFISQQFKRSCMPDGPKIGSVSLSPRGDFSMPSDAAMSLWQKELEKL